MKKKTVVGFFVHTRSVLTDGLNKNIKYEKAPTPFQTENILVCFTRDLVIPVAPGGVTSAYRSPDDGTFRSTTIPPDKPAGISRLQTVREPDPAL